MTTSNTVHLHDLAQNESPADISRFHWTSQHGPSRNRAKIDIKSGVGLPAARIEALDPDGHNKRAFIREVTDTLEARDAVENLHSVELSNLYALWRLDAIERTRQQAEEKARKREHLIMTAARLIILNFTEGPDALRSGGFLPSHDEDGNEIDYGRMITPVVPSTP